MTADKKLYCKKCRKEMDVSNFYISRRTDKYPDGYMDTCKKCMTMHVNSWQPSTFIEILKEADVPYIEREWNSLLETYAKDPKKVTGMTILGRYLSKMKLTQFNRYRWSDTEELAREELKKRQIEEAQIKDKQRGVAAKLSSYQVLNLDPGRISDAEYELMSDSDLGIVPPPLDHDIPSEEDWNDISFSDGLTKEDKRYLNMKWGKLYSVEEWIALEKFYYEMMESFDIQTAAHKNYLLIICKTQLKVNQALDCSDIEGYQKLAKVYDTLMKSAKFTAAQEKAENGEFVDSVGELVYLAEEQGFIPRYHTDEPKDIVDVTLRDMKGYSYKLVTEEMGLGNMIEAALQQMHREQEQEEGELEEGDDVLNPDFDGVLNDEDYEEYYDELEQQAAQDQEKIEEAK